MKRFTFFLTHKFTGEETELVVLSQSVTGAITQLVRKYVQTVAESHKIEWTEELA